MSENRLRGCPIPPTCDLQGVLRSSLQEEVDRNLNKPVEGFKTMLLRDKQGDLDLPKDVHVRLYNCTIGKLVTNGNNNIYLNNCILQQPCSLTNTSMITDQTTFDRGGSFSQSVIELINDTIIKDTILLENGTQVTSNKSTWDGEDVSTTIPEEEKETKFFIRLSSGSVFTSNSDTYKNINFSIYEGFDGSVLNISSPSFQFCGELGLKTKKLKLPELKIPNIPEYPFPTCGLLPNLNSYIVLVNGLLNLSQIENRINKILNDLNIKVCLDIPSVCAKISCRTVMSLKDFGFLATVKESFKLNDSAKLNISIGDSLLSQTNIISADNKSLFSVRGLVALVSKDSVTKLNDSSGEISTIAKLEAQVGSIFDVDNNSKLNIYDVSKFIGVDSIVRAKKESLVRIKEFNESQSKLFAEVLDNSKVDVTTKKDTIITTEQLVNLSEGSSFNLHSVKEQSG